MKLLSKLGFLLFVTFSNFAIGATPIELKKGNYYPKSENYCGFQYQGINVDFNVMVFLPIQAKGGKPCSYNQPFYYKMAPVTANRWYQYDFSKGAMEPSVSIDVISESEFYITDINSQRFFELAPNF